MTLYRLKPFLLAALIIVTGMSQAEAAGRVDGIAAVVNDRAITRSDLNDRVNLLIQSSGLPANKEVRDRIQQQVLTVLVEEQLKMQAAKDAGVKVDDKMIDAGFAKVAEQNKLTPEQFAGIIKKQGLNLSTLRDQIAAEVAWGQVVSKKLRPRIEVSQADIQAEQDRLRANIGKTQYRLAEIFLAVDRPQDDEKVKGAIAKLHNQLTAKPQIFPQVAQQFSQAAGAAKGGDLGWVEQSQLPEGLAQIVPTLGKGALSAPIRSLSGYHILLLRDMRVMGEAEVPSADDIMDRIGTERLVRAARGYMQDLKRTASIELRV